jgi:hypothetical protein
MPVKVSGAAAGSSPEVGAKPHWLDGGGGGGLGGAKAVTAKPAALQFSSAGTELAPASAAKPDTETADAGTKLLLHVGP